MLGAACLADKVNNRALSGRGPARTFMANVLIVVAAWTIVLLLPESAAGPWPFFLMVGELFATAALPLTFSRMVFGPSRSKSADRDTMVASTASGEPDAGEASTGGFTHTTLLVACYGFGLLSSWYLNFLFAATGAVLPISAEDIDYFVGVGAFSALAVLTGYAAFRRN